MGYTTEFQGKFWFSRELTAKEKRKINDFGEERHGGDREPYPGFPGFWCDWRTNGRSLFWGGQEKFYAYVEWLEYLIDHFFKPWDVKLNGKVFWRGEDFYDIGKITVEDNCVVVDEIKLEENGFQDDYDYDWEE